MRNTPRSPLEIASKNAKSLTKEYEEAKAVVFAANQAVDQALNNLIEKPSQENSLAVRKAQTEVVEATKKLEQAFEKSQKATKELSTMKIDRSMNVSGSDRIQLACFIASFTGVNYTQEELIGVAVEQTGKTTVGQYGYFKRVARIAKLYGIEVSIKFPAEMESNGVK